MSERLVLPREKMRKLGYRVVDMLIDHTENLSKRPVGCKATRAALEARLREPVPQTGVEPEAVLELVERFVLSQMLHVDHPRFFAFIPSPSNFVSVLADALVSGFNVYAGTWLEGSGAAEIELVTVEWLRQLSGMPETAGGLFLSGGSTANLTALTLARDAKLRGPIESGVVYCSDQTHASIDRGLRVLGFKNQQVRRLGTDEGFRLSLSELERAMALDRSRRKKPFCVVANAGTTNTGAVDPLPELAEVCRKEDLWLHVDGAYGAAGVLSKRGRELLRGLEDVDSLTLDPHKWMFQPYEIGCLLVRDRRALLRSFHYLPEYLHDAQGTEEELNFYDYGIQLTRSFRALKLWLSLKVFGLRSFREAVERGFALAELAERHVRQSRLLKLVTPAQMGILTYRFEPSEEDDWNDLNGRIVREMVAEGYALVSSTQLRGKTVLHMCTINPRTADRDIGDTIKRVEAIGARLAEKGP